jgi:hypothetical protein
MLAEFIGFVASCSVLYAFTFKRELPIRIFSWFGSFMWLIYGILLGAISVIIFNVLLIGIHTLRIMTLLKESTDE